LLAMQISGHIASMTKRFLIIAILAVVASNINLFIRDAYPINHGRGSDMPGDVCPIKGVSHGSGSSHHGHDAHHPPDTPSLKCDCSYDYFTSFVYEPGLTNHVIRLIPYPFVSYNNLPDNPTYTSRTPIPIEGPPEFLA